MTQPIRCLLVHPRFHEESFWNYRVTFELRGASYPAAPLGLVTVAALLPPTWVVKLIDRNVTEFRDEDIEWADLVMTGGMIAQQVSTLKLIDRIKAMGKTVVVGGPDPTSSPHLYAAAVPVNMVGLLFRTPEHPAPPPSRRGGALRRLQEFPHRPPGRIDRELRA